MAPPGRIFYALLSISILLFGTAATGLVGSAGGQSSGGESSILSGDVKSRQSTRIQDLAYKRVDPDLLEIFRSDNPAAVAAEHGAKYGSDRTVPAFVHLSNNYTALILPRSLQITGQADNIVVAKIPYSALSTIAQIRGVQAVTLPERAVPAAASEGVSTTYARNLQLQGLNGNGVTVAVIDDSFIVSNPEIASNIVATRLFDSGRICGGSIQCGKSNGNSHGTAVAEIIVDMAPSVRLVLYAIGNTVDFSNAIDDAIARGDVDVISISLGFPAAGGDGTTKHFRDGTSVPAKAVNKANSAGILTVVSAGNEGSSHWKGTYSAAPLSSSSIGLPSSYQSVMNFQPSAAGTQQACLPVNIVDSQVILTWNAWATTNQDYDLFLFNTAMTSIIASSIDDQNALNLSPIEDMFPIGSGSACIVVASWSSTQNHLLHVYVGGGGSIPTANGIPSGSIGTPADASGALTVGAVNQATDTLESFSSQGPTDDGRLKPEICGPDNTFSNQYGGAFFGTSAAAPHVSGAAALLLQQQPSLTVSQLKTKLISESRFNSGFSVDNRCGSTSGMVTLSSCLPPGSGDWVITSHCVVNRSAVAPGNVTVQNGATLTIPQGLSLDIDLKTKKLLVKSGAGVKIKAGGKIY